MFIYTIYIYIYTVCVSMRIQAKFNDFSCLHSFLRNSLKYSWPSMVLKSIKSKVVIKKKVNWYGGLKFIWIWKRVSCILIHMGYQNDNIMTAAQCSWSIVNSVSCDMDNCNGDYEAITSRKGYNRYSDWV